jgi:hypothetical protein
LRQADLHLFDHRPIGHLLAQHLQWIDQRQNEQPSFALRFSLSQRLDLGQPHRLHILCKTQRQNPLLCCRFQQPMIFVVMQNNKE